MGDYYFSESGSGCYLLDQIKGVGGEFDSRSGVFKRWCSRAECGLGVSVGVVGVLVSGEGSSVYLSGYGAVRVGLNPIEFAGYLRKVGGYFRILLLEGVLRGRFFNGFVYVYYEKDFKLKEKKLRKLMELGG